jgi:hypothetical protein
VIVGGGEEHDALSLDALGEIDERDAAERAFVVDAEDLVAPRGGAADRGEELDRGREGGLGAVEEGVVEDAGAVVADGLLQDDALVDDATAEAAAALQGDGGGGAAGEVDGDEVFASAGEAGVGPALEGEEVGEVFGDDPRVLAAEADPVGGRMRIGRPDGGSAGDLRARLVADGDGVDVAEAADGCRR